MQVDAQDIIDVLEVDLAEAVQPGHADIVDDAVEGIALGEVSEGVRRSLAVIEID
jgi:hypothetical protein